MAQSIQKGTAYSPRSEGSLFPSRHDQNAATKAGQSSSWEGLWATEIQAKKAKGKLPQAALKPHLKEELGKPITIWVSLDDCLSAIGLHRIQILILFLSGLGYGHFTTLTLSQSFVTQPLWLAWPHLADRPVYYNSVFAAVSVSRLLGSLLLLPWVDKFGRLPFFLGCTIFSTLLGLASSFVPNFGLYCLFRALVSLLTSVLPSLATVYAVEMLPIAHRGLSPMLNQTISSCWLVLSSMIKTAVDSSDQIRESHRWRYDLGFFMIPTILLIVGLSLLRIETPRFLAANRKDIPGTWRALDSLAPNRNVKALLCPDPRVDVRVRLLGLEEDEALPREVDGQFTPLPVHSTTTADATLAMVSPQTTSVKHTLFYTISKMWMLCTDPLYRSETFWIGLCWTLQSFSQWGLATYMTVFFANIGINADWSTTGAFLCQIPAQFFCYYLMTADFWWAGRIFAIRSFAITCALVHGVLALCIFWGLRNITVLTILGLGCFFSGGPIWGALYAYSIERYPTVHRGAATAFFGVLASLSIVATTYIGSITLSARGKWMYPLVWAGFRTALALTTFFFRSETKSMPLPDSVGQVEANA